MNQIITDWYDQYGEEVWKLSMDLFDDSELGLKTFKSCAQTADFMKKHGFTVKTYCMGGVEAPNTLVATYGSGHPVIGILGEFDALPKLSNKPVPYEDPIVEGGPGHGCGHHLMGAGCAAAAVAAKAVMDAEHLEGTVVYYGCPAEEILEGKVYMAQAGLFDGLDFCLAWHPSPWAAPSPFSGSLQAVVNVLYDFYGVSAHAAGAPQNGRSALDAAELMTVGVNYLREHVDTDVRMHYCYTAAGESPNVVPAFAQVNFFIRAKDMASVEAVRARVRACAEGAALMTGTTTKEKLVVGSYETFVNHTANDFVYDVIMNNPPLEYTKEDEDFAATLYKNLFGKAPKGELLSTEVVKPTRDYFSEPGSTDVGDVSQLVPTVQLYGGAEVAGTLSHHWSVTAATGSHIGYVAEVYAGKILAESTYQALCHPEIIKKMWEEFDEARRDKPTYKAMLPDE